MKIESAIGFEIEIQNGKGSFIFAFDKENYNFKVQEEDVRSILSQ